MTFANRKEKATGGIFAAGFRLAEAFDIAADVYHGVSFLQLSQLCRPNSCQFVFWSILTSLGVVIWCK